jgi:hypothetical protein
MTRLVSRFWQEAGRASGRESDRSTELVATPKRFLDEVARAGFRGSELGKILGDA